MKILRIFAAIGLLAFASCGEVFAQATGSAGYPPGSTPQSNAVGGADTSSSSISLQGSASQFAYICYFEINGLGATAATTVQPSLAGLESGQTFVYSYIFPAGATVASTPVTRTFTPCLRSNAVGGAITLSVPGAAGNTSTILEMTGYVQ